MFNSQKLIEILLIQSSTSVSYNSLTLIIIRELSYSVMFLQKGFRVTSPLSTKKYHLRSMKHPV